MESSWDGHPSVRFFPIFAQHFWNAVLVIDGFSITSLTKAQTHLGKRVCLCVFVCVGCSIDHTCEVHISSYLIPHMHNFASVLKIFTYFKRCFNVASMVHIASPQLHISTDSFNSSPSCFPEGAHMQCICYLVGHPNMKGAYLFWGNPILLRSIM